MRNPQHNLLGRFFEWRYGVLCAMLLVLTALRGVLRMIPGETHFHDVIVLGVIMLTVASTARTVRGMLITTMLVLTLVVCLEFGRQFEFHRVTVAATVVVILCLVWCTVVVLGDVVRCSSVSLNEIFGAICGYLLIAFLMGASYNLLETLYPNSFLLKPEDTGPGQMNALVYFSLVTLSTVGYGDIVPLTREARSLVVMEAIIGQFYLAVLVARLMGSYLASTGVRVHRSEREDVA